MSHRLVSVILEKSTSHGYRRDVYSSDALYSVCCNIYNLSLYLQKYVTVSVASLYVSLKYVF